MGEPLDLKMAAATERLFSKMSEDKAFAELILSQTERDMVIELAGKAGISLTPEDIDEANRVTERLRAFYQDNELSEEDLEAVAGGVLTAKGTEEAVSLATITPGASPVRMITPELPVTITVNNPIGGK